MQRLRLISAVMCLLAFGVKAAYPQGGQVSPAARAMCMEMEKGINNLAPFTQTSCRVGGGNSKESLSFLVISLGVVWDNDESKAAWFEAVVESAAAVLNANAEAKIDEIIVSDPSQLADRLAFALPAAAVKSLQGKISDGSVKKGELFPLIEKELIKKPIIAR